jgi:hypothetical protein
MTDNAKRALKVILDLQETDQKEIAKTLTEYLNKSTNEQRTFSENYKAQNRVLGPVSSNACAYCGK